MRHKRPFEYVRQSSSYQVIYHEEIRRLQYAMRERLE
jgi:DNA invertase Pin-like site-specific DNA recombinase